MNCLRIDYRDSFIPPHSYYSFAIKLLQLLLPKADCYRLDSFIARLIELLITLERFMILIKVAVSSTIFNTGHFESKHSPSMKLTNAGPILESRSHMLSGMNRPVLWSVMLSVLKMMAISYLI